MAEEKGREDLLDRTSRREALFDLDAIAGRSVPAPGDVDRSVDALEQQVRRAHEVITAHETSYVSELRTELDDELLRALDDMTEPSGIVFGQMKALRALGRRMDAELAWARGVIGDAG